MAKKGVVSWGRRARACKCPLPEKMRRVIAFQVSLGVEIKACGKECGFPAGHAGPCFKDVIEEDFAYAKGVCGNYLPDSPQNCLMRLQGDGKEKWHDGLCYCIY